MLCHSGNKRSNAGDAGDHLVHNVIEIPTVGKIQWGIKGHLVAVKNQLDLKQWGEALRSLCVVYQVLQRAAHGIAEARQNHLVHMISVGLPLNAVHACHAKQVLVLLQQRKHENQLDSLFEKKKKSF